MKKSTSILAVIAVLLVGSLSHGAVVTQWDFNSLPSDDLNTSGTLTPNLGTGSLGLLGTTTATFSGGTLNPSQSSDPNVGANNSGWNITTFNSATEFSDGIQALVSTVGFQNVSVSWDQRTSNSSSKHVAFFYTIDGANWLQASGTTFTIGQVSGALNTAIDSVVGNLFVNGSGDRFHNNRTVDLSTISGVNDNPNFGFRIVSAFDPNTSQFVGTNGTFATSGSWRFDMVTVNATAVPEPASIALMAIASFSGFAVRRFRMQKLEQNAV